MFVALTLGLGWAIRGHFGHEWGASWAGAMAGLAIITASGRKDWLARLPVLAFLAAIGWAVGGMMSYGIVVGYCRGTGFGNVLYGFTMLAVIGGLYGFIGGGLFGLGLESEEKRRPDWPSLITQMVAGGYLFWGILIYQFEWKMTPPRSELWAACLGAALALAWYLQRKGYNRALRVAAYSALGGGFGFAFGNFLQVMGNLTGLHFNWWNVMEFTLGFCGGLGMAYGVFSREWPKAISPSKSANWLAWIFLLVAIPVTNIINVFEKKNFFRMAEQIGHANPGQFFTTQLLFAFVAVLVFSIFGFWIWKRFSENQKFLVTVVGPALFFAVSLYYLAFSHLVKGVFYGAGGTQLEQYLYWVILLFIFLIWFVNRKKESQVFSGKLVAESWGRWLFILLGVLFIFVVLTLISTNSHPPLPGAHERF